MQHYKNIVYDSGLKCGGEWVNANFFLYDEEYEIGLQLYNQTKQSNFMENHKWKQIFFMKNDGEVTPIKNVPLGLFSADSIALTVFGGIPKNHRVILLT